MNNNLDYNQITKMNKEKVLTLFKTNEQGLNENEVNERINHTN